MGVLGGGVLGPGAGGGGLEEEEEEHLPHCHGGGQATEAGGRQDWPLMATRLATHGHKSGHSWPQDWPLMATILATHGQWGLSGKPATSLTSIVCTNNILEVFFAAE